MQTIHTTKIATYSIGKPIKLNSKKTSYLIIPGIVDGLNLLKDKLKVFLRGIIKLSCNAPKNSTKSETIPQTQQLDSSLDKIDSSGRGSLDSNQKPQQ